MLFSIVSIIILLIVFIPVLNYWKTIFEKDQFHDGRELLGFASFRALFDYSLLYLFVKNFKTSDTDFSLIPYFLFVHLLCFSVFTIVLQFIFGLFALNIGSKNICHTNWKEKETTNKSLKYILMKYYALSDENNLALLSTKFSKIYLTLSYLVSGIISASNFGNGILLKILKANPNISSSFQTIYSNDQQLYSSVFIISFVPIFTAYIVNSNIQKKV